MVLTFVSITNNSQTIIKHLKRKEKRVRLRTKERGDFIEKGGIKEEMYRARKDWQNRNGMNGYNGVNGQIPNQPIKPTKPLNPKS